jgi:inner membrane protein
MENVTHSLIGAVVGEGIARARLGRKSPAGAALDPADVRRMRSGVLMASVLGNNLPDFDFLLRPVFGGGSLGSVLHHRGYTHTVLLAIPLGLLAAAIGRLATRGRAVKTPWSLLIFTGILGVFCHIGADLWNDYGVHPFWPVVNRWFYGDFIFIIEPLFWLSLTPFVFRSAHTAWARALCLILGGGILALSWSGKYMSWPVAAWLTAWALLWIGVHLKKRSVAYPLGAILAVLLLFAIPGQLVRARLRSILPPGEELLRLSTTPAPSNPLCWRVILTTRTPRPVGNPPVDYFARQGVMVFRPFGLGEDGRFGPNNPRYCPPRVFGENSAFNSQVTAVSLLQPDLTWAGEFHGNTSELEVAKTTHCRARELLRFVRMPFWLAAPDGHLIVGDLRYHSGDGLGFADVESYAGEPCFAHEPSWTPPSGL